MPRGLAIILCYVVFLAALGLFMAALLPRLSKDAARIGSEAPELYKKLNDQWAPQLAHWLERRFPSMAPPLEADAVEPVVADVPVPPNTQFVVTPLPDGRFAITMEDSGIELSPQTNGGFVVTPRDEPPEAKTLEDRLRQLARDWIGKLQSQLGDVFRFGQAVIKGLIRGVFTFFLVLMIAAFILLDIEKIHAFARSLVPSQYQNDYEVIAAGIDRGLSGVIRGQLMICLVNGILTYIGLVIFGVKYSLILAVVAGVLSLIPIFGSILSTIPIVLAALVSTDAGVDAFKAIAMLAWIIGIHLLEANMLNPKIIGTAAKIHPVLVIFALVVGEHSYGLTGALLAVPVASIVQVLFLFFRRKAWQKDTPPGPATAVSLDGGTAT
jgi:predicted PurR-regulated permease PerM